MHSLVSSLSNIGHSISVEKEKSNTIECVQECLIAAFPRRNQYKEPDLHKIILGFDRGYNGFLNLVSYILKCGGNTFGTSKRALHNIYTYDQFKRDCDKKSSDPRKGRALYRGCHVLLKTQILKPLVTFIEMAMAEQYSCNLHFLNIKLIAGTE